MDAAILRAGGVVFLLEDDAELMVGRVSGSQVQEVKRYTVADTATWTAPSCLDVASSSKTSPHSHSGRWTDPPALETSTSATTTRAGETRGIDRWLLEAAPNPRRRAWTVGRVVDDGDSAARRRQPYEEIAG